MSKFQAIIQFYGRCMAFKNNLRAKQDFGAAAILMDVADDFAEHIEKILEKLSEIFFNLIKDEKHFLARRELGSLRQDVQKFSNDWKKIIDQIPENEFAKLFNSFFVIVREKNQLIDDAEIVQSLVELNKELVKFVLEGLQANRDIINYIKSGKPLSLVDEWFGIVKQTTPTVSKFQKYLEQSARSGGYAYTYTGHRVRRALTELFANTLMYEVSNNNAPPAP